MDLRERVLDDYERMAREGLPRPFDQHIRETYGITLAATYAGYAIPNPFGKASGQLSLNASHVARDCEAGLGFVVLKTLIAEDERGEQSMSAWAIPAARMVVEPISGTRPNVQGERGWTVTWRGRGWSESFANYLQLFDTALGQHAGFLVVPSVKYHLPKPGETTWRTAEYEYTTTKLYEVWRRHRSGPMPIEKDFSPTLAGDRSFAEEREQILEWLTIVPRLLRETTHGKHLRIGLKLFNATHSDDFQLDLLRHVCNDGLADYIIYGNRLFDRMRSFEGVTGAAYGGPDLSDRNLWALRNTTCTLPLSATGNIVTGQLAFEYLQQGATSLQMHTLFQLPDSEFAMTGGTRTERALHRLLFHPEHGYIAAVLDARATDTTSIDKATH